METLIGWILPLLSNNPHFAVVMTLMVFCRTVFKPTCALIQLYVDQTETRIDNDEWIKIQNSKGFKAVTWCLDYFTSIKIPKA